MADIPWVATFDTRVTTSAQEGFDIVLLFGREMKSCVLSLNQGYTAFTKEFKKESLALKKIQQTAERARANLSPVPGASYGAIDLQAETVISKGYELGAIASFVYKLNSLPSSEEFEKNYLDLLTAYDQLYALAGKNLMSLQAMTDSEFQSEIEESLAVNDLDEELGDPIGPEIKPNKLPSVAGTKYKRDVNKSKSAI
jgi:5-methylcytosine-specific restriction protein A